MTDARKRAEEALRSCIRAMNDWAAQEDGLPDTAADAVEEALSAISLLASEPAKVSGSVSIVRSDDPPAKPLPTCVNCGSNFITPAPPDGAEVREAAERADKAMRDVFGGVDQFGDYCGHPVMPGKLAHAVQELLAALRGGQKGEA